MSRFTLSILLATALLGVLLWIVVSMAVDFAQAPEEPLEQPEPAIEYDPALPRLADRAELVAYLNGNGLPGFDLVAGLEDWLDERGYPPAVFNATAEPDALVTEASDPELLLLAGIGDIDALHELADRSLQDGQNPLEAIEWYDQAIVSGSLYAMLRRADLLDTLSDPVLGEFLRGGEWPDELQRLTADRATALQEALSWALSAYIVGGAATMDAEQSARLDLLSDELRRLDNYAIDQACASAQEHVLEAAASRRALGGSVFSTAAPPFALTVARPEQHVPCSVPIVPLVSLEQCEYFEFVEPEPNRLMRAWICP